jgi:hypothetical protein
MKRPSEAEAAADEIASLWCRCSPELATSDAPLRRSVSATPLPLPSWKSPSS